MLYSKPTVVLCTIFNLMHYKLYLLFYKKCIYTYVTIYLSNSKIIIMHVVYNIIM